MTIDQATLHKIFYVTFNFQIHEKFIGVREMPGFKDQNVEVLQIFAARHKFHIFWLL